MSQDYNNQIRDSKSVVNPEQWKAKLMMFTDNEEIPKFQKEELKEEEKEFLQQQNLKYALFTTVFIYSLSIK